MSEPAEEVKYVPKKNEWRETGLRYVFAGISCMCAAAATNPIDVTKIRMQLEGELNSVNARSAYQHRYYKGIIRGAFTIAKDEGIRGLYKGLTPALVREASYSSIRIGAYEPIKRLFGATDPAHTPLYKKIASGATSGAIGSWIATPTDLIRVRLQAEARLEPGQQPRYRGFLHAVTDIAKAEGLRGLYRGTVPTVQRAMILTAAQVPAYDHTKHTMLNLGWMEEGMKLHTFSSMVAGFVAALATSPVDVIKTRVMNQKIKDLPKEKRAYKGSLDCFLKTVQSEGTNPVEVTKVRIQLEGELIRQSAATAYRQRYYKGLLSGLVTVARDEGIRGLYKGLTPSLIREAIYSTLRLGAYEPIKNLYGAKDPTRTPLSKKLAAGATSGALGSWFANPMDIVRIRLQGDGKPLPGQQPRYRGFLHAFTDIAKAEGLRGLYRGTVPTVQRAMILTAAQVPTYDHTKHTILNRGWMTEGAKLHFVSSMGAGFTTAFATSPVDVIKTRIMNQKIKGIPRDQIMYRGSLDCLLKTLRSEGLYGLYKGFFSNWLRLGPHTCISLLIFEQLRRLAGIQPL